MMNAEPPDFLKPGARLDASYRIRRWKGGGAYGDVYECERKGRPYALKLSKHRQSSDDPGKTDQRLLRELVCLVQLDHPNIAKVLGWTRTEAGYGYLVMEYVEGWTLAAWIQEARPTFQQVLHVFARLVDALAYMHRRGVRHRDISLSNVMVRRADGEPVIIDLGAGEYSGAHELTDAPLPPGTNRYRSPEAARFYKEHENDRSARYDFPAEDDFYSLAVCLYDALTDAEPARRAGARKAPRLNVNSPTLAPPPARKVNPRVPEALSAWVERWLVRDVEPRRPALAAMAGALEELGRQGGAEWRATVQPPPEAGTTAPERPQARARRRVLAWAVAAAVLVVAAAVAWPRVAPSPEAPPSRAAPKPSTDPRAKAPDTPPSPPVPSVGAVPSPSQLPPAEKESLPVSAPMKPPPSPAAAKKPKKAAPAFSPKSLTQGAVAGVCAAALGCPASQVTPTREACPPDAVEAMEYRGLPDGKSLRLNVDVSQPDAVESSDECRARDRWQKGVGCFALVGDGKIVSVVTHGWRGLPEGTRLYGQLWTSGDTVVGRYTRAVVPSEVEYSRYEDAPGGRDFRDFPVCISLSLNGGVKKFPGSEPGAAIVDAKAPARFVYGQWP
ncbi:serine/threonine-protein kinase [Myxococcus sp. RHSTA-1-4]|uniref:serine/threonine protein kinase n=1 Tax=Myxococcus sp. RHSTA-1-4 TaxID=2874601 RepID=UPI001CBCAB71|nr:serine/threonine-protein kinase [Myxococcus sp. RHSTA-1-4]MBZ4418831.1 protein kinase [Myxococcus sp. RHSTA-1-4]